ncbi:autoinducer binding domain-containing protein [Phaeobacter gallaeciensis]|uniref:helix-turn-helix transcriptional regulator n=1 Tax=Phaeobacter gallaeciensis TaxID=60890 RepID=UPI003A8A1EE3
MRTLEAISTNGFSLGVGFDGAEPVFMKSTYSREWIDHYLVQRYFDLDPTIHFGKTATGFTTWDELRLHYPNSNKFFDDAARFGLSEGNTLSIHVDGQVSILSCSGPRWKDTERRLAKAALYTIHAIHHRDSSRFVIKEKSKDVIRLMCAGCQDREIAERLGVKLETVRQRRQTAMQALEATSTAQLISLVIKYGLI